MLQVFSGSGGVKNEPKLTKIVDLSIVQKEEIPIMETTQKAKHRFLNLSLKSDIAFTTLLVSAYFVLALIGILNHEMWRDELHAWMIARDSASLGELFRNLRYEGHPGLWHLCLYFLSKFTRNPLAMQLFHLAIATGCVYLFAKFSPFSRLHKVLFTFGYFSLYEYAIISRNYNIGILLIFLFCIFFQTRHRTYLILASILAILANTNAFAFIFAFGLAMTLVFERIIDRSNNHLFYTKKWDTIFSIAIFCTGIILALIQLIPPSDSDFIGDKDRVVQNPELKSLRLGRLAQSIMRIWRTYVPIPNIFNYNLWNSNIIGNDYAIEKIAVLLLSLGFLFITSTLFLRKPVILFMYLSITSGIILFHYGKFLGTLRHSGHLFLLVFVCFWLYNDTKTIPLRAGLEKLYSFFNRYKKQYLTVLLCTHVIAAISLYSMDLKYPFSGSKEAANFIESQGLSDTLIVGSFDMTASTVAAMLDRKIYYPESKSFRTFVEWNQRSFVNDREIMAQIDQLIVEQNSPSVLLIRNRELDKSQAERPDLSISYLFRTYPSIVGDERFSLYTITRN